MHIDAHTHTYTHIYTHIYIYIYICMIIYKYTHTYIYIYIHMLWVLFIVCVPVVHVVRNKSQVFHGVPQYDPVIGQIQASLA